MNLPPDYFSRFQKKTGPRSERAELIGRIEKFTNTSRVAAGYKPYHVRYIATLVSHLKTSDLRDHLFQAEKQENTSRWFWGKLKTKD